jgi:hypothetical protein
MHAHEQVEVAAVVAVNAADVLSRGQVSANQVVPYWTASRIRLDCWSLALKEYLQLQISSTPQVSAAGPLVVGWRTVRPVVEEILTAEVLTRVWSSIVSLANTRHALAPVVRRVYIGHLEARNRALNVLVYGRGFDSQEAAELNTLRRRCERWADLLLAYVLNIAPEQSRLIEEYGFEPERLHEFARDLSEDCNGLSAQLLQSSLRAAFGTREDSTTPHPGLNQRIAEAVFASLPADLSRAAGRSTNRWLDRIAQVTSDTEGMIQELLAIEGYSSPR